MKVVQTPARFYPYIGGVESYVLNLSKHLVELGHEVAVICANEPNAEIRNIADEFRIKRLSYIHKIANTNITLGLPFELLNADFDLIHTHLPTPWSADWSAIAAIARRKPLVLTYHNDIVGDGFAGNLAYLYNHANLKVILGRAARVIITQPNYLEFSPYLKKYGDKIEIIPVGVDIEKFKPAGTEVKDSTLFFLSVLDKFHRYKGLEYLLLALARVKREVPDVRLLVGGDGDLRAHYIGMAKSLGLARNVEFVGFIPEDRVVEFYNICSMFVLPTISPKQEGFGTVLLEAMACAKPIIGTEVVGVADDIKKHGGGIIVKRRNEEELAEAIIRILEDKKRAALMGSIGRQIVEEKYSWRRVAEKIEDLYDELVCE
jgi:glycosyltransferase involved in cell wall biosynthesis